MFFARRSLPTLRCISIQLVYSGDECIHFHHNLSKPSNKAVEYSFRDYIIETDFYIMGFLREVGVVRVSNWGRTYSIRENVIQNNTLYSKDNERSLGFSSNSNLNLKKCFKYTQEVLHEMFHYSNYVKIVIQ